MEYGAAGNNDEVYAVIILLIDIIIKPGIVRVLFYIAFVILKPALMKKVILVLGFLFISLSGNAQSQGFNGNINQLIKISVSTEMMDGFKKIMISELMGIEREGFSKDYDSITNDYIVNFGKFYDVTYTEKEVNGLIDFYKTPTGIKFLKSKKKLQDSFFNRDKEATSFLNSSLITNIQSLEDATGLIEKTGLRNYLDVVKEYEILWTTPEKEEAYSKQYDLAASVFVEYAADYYYKHLTENEIKDVLSFYNNELGRKVQANAEAFYRMELDAYLDWAGSSASLSSQTNFGKYQR
jgi:hypothetical protein